MIDDDDIDSAAPLPSPWDEVRASMQPGARLVRCIFRERGLQFFLELQSRDQVTDLYDGATVWSPAMPAEFTEEQRRELARSWDNHWHKNKKCHSSTTSPTTGSNA